MKDNDFKLDKIKNARKNLNLSLRALAKRVGVSQEAISSYEKGVYPPRQEVWEILKGVLGLTGEVREYWGREVNEAAKNTQLCAVPGCSRPFYAKRCCSKHYRTLWYHRATHGIELDISSLGTASEPDGVPSSDIEEE